MVLMIFCTLVSRRADVVVRDHVLQMYQKQVRQDAPQILCPDDADHLETGLSVTSMLSIDVVLHHLHRLTESALGGDAYRRSFEIPRA